MSWLHFARMCKGLAVIAVLLIVGGCSADDTASPTIQSGAVPLSQSLEHIHGLAVDPADGTVYAGTHAGVWLVDPTTGEVHQVGSSRDDFMGFTSAGPGRFMSSGHPAPGSDASNPVGLIESVDRGKTWQTVGLETQADFHVMAVAGHRVAAWSESTGFVLSDDGGRSWRDGPAVQPVAMAWLDKVLWIVSDKGLVTLEPGDSVTAALSGSPDLLALATAGDARRLWGIAGDGGVWSSSDGQSWRLADTVTAADAFAAGNTNKAYVITTNSMTTIER